MPFTPFGLTSGSGGGLQAWQFTPESRGAKRDGKIIVDATIAAGALSTLTSASANFTSADTGKSIIITQAGGLVSGFAQPLAATITFVSSTTVTLSTPAAAGGVTNVGAIYGTDDTAAVQSAVNAATAYAQAQATSYGEVVFSAGLYCIAGAAVIGGGTAGNSQITLPVITASAGNKVNLALRGPGPVASAPEHWLQVTANPVGATLVCMRTDGTYDGTNGPAAVIGGPVAGYGGGGGTYSNMQLVVDGLTMLMPYQSTYGGLMAYGLGQIKVGSFSVMPMAVVPAATPWPQLGGAGPSIGPLQYTSGLIGPVTGNNALWELDSFTCYGMFIGWAGCDHMVVKSARTIFCSIGWLPNNAPQGGGQGHNAFIGKWTCEQSTNPIQAYSAATFGGYKLSGTASVFVAALSLETYNSGFIYKADAGVINNLYGTIYFEDLQPGAHYYSGLLEQGLNLKLIKSDRAPGPISAPQAAPATTVAWPNLYYGDAEITLTVTTGTLSALTITGPAGAVAQTIPASTTFYRFTLPSGMSYTPTYTGTLTHTVTLL